MAGLWTEVCLTCPALSATEDGYEVFAVVDASTCTRAPAVTVCCWRHSGQARSARRWAWGGCARH
ncbi:hypothetical protein ACGFY3_44305 [Streptomyces mirabilis]|uniref:hypothetical protein n=1 Tax=Streptomyces mirabilis TaxID=68239 RepID=UPI0037210E7C